MSASFSCTSWWLASGLSSNCLRAVRVGSGGFVAIHRRAEHAPADSVARLREAGERAFESLRAGQHGGIRYAAVGEREAGRDGSAHGPFAVNVGCGEARRTALDQEAPDAVVGARPDHGDVGDGTVGDPGLFAVEYPAGAVAHGAGAHAGGVGAEIGFGEAEAADGVRRTAAAAASGSSARRSRTRGSDT